MILCRIHESGSNMKKIGLLIGVALFLSGCIAPPPSGSNGPGDHAKFFLQGHTFTRLIVEIDYVDGYAPSMEAVNLLETRLDSVTDKNEISFSQRNFSSDQNRYSIDDIKELEKKNRDFEKGEFTVVIYLLYLNGEFEDNENVLGITYSASAVAIFKEKIDSMDIPLWAALSGLSTEDYEKSVLIHEAGHLLGLVNEVYTSQKDHEDPNHPHHSTNDKSVMYWAIEQATITDLVTRDDPEPPTQFDDDDKDDLMKLKNDFY